MPFEIVKKELFFEKDAGYVYDKDLEDEIDGISPFSVDRTKENLVESYLYQMEGAAFVFESIAVFITPKDLGVVKEAIKAFSEDWEDTFVHIVIVDSDAFLIDENLKREIDQYLEEKFEMPRFYYQRMKPPMYPWELEERLKSIALSFSRALFALIKEKGMSETEVYKRANVDRRLFSKIRTQDDYTPSKETIISLSIALELSLEETNYLLEKAGYTLSHSDRFDVIVEYFIVNKFYDIYEINEALFKYTGHTLS